MDQGRKLNPDELEVSVYINNVTGAWAVTANGLPQYIPDAETWDRIRNFLRDRCEEFLEPQTPIPDAFIKGMEGL